MQEDKFVKETSHPEKTAGATRENEIINQEHRHKIAERERNEKVRQRYYNIRRIIEWFALAVFLVIVSSFVLAFLFPELFKFLAWENLTNALFVVVGSAIGGLMGHFLWKLFSPYDR